MTARKPARLEEMVEVVLDEASRLRASQRALVLAGLRTSPDARQMRKADVYDDIARLLWAIIPLKQQVHAVLAPELKAMRTADEYPKRDPGRLAPDLDENNISDD